MKKFGSIILISIIAFILSCNLLLFKTNISKDNKLEIVRKPDSTIYRFGKLDSLKKYDENSIRNFERDLRCYDPSSLDLQNNLNELLHSDFDSKTTWPKSLPVGFNPDSIMEIGKNPGLNVHELHKIGITGKGVGIAIIDQNLLIDHIEYKDRIKMYEEIHVVENGAQMHGPAVASIAVGKTVGVAPEADLYYISSGNMTSYTLIKNFLFKKGLDFKDIDPKWFVKSIYRILEINKTLPMDKKIRVISISLGIYTKAFLKAVEVAGKEGVFVISCSLYKTHNYRFFGLGRNCLSNPDDINSYSFSALWLKQFNENQKYFVLDSTLLVPMDYRCTASQSGNNSYALYSTGGLSWCVPYIAGLYALACQVKQSITPNEFWNKALETGDIIEIQKNNKKYKYGKIVNPVKLIEALREINNLDRQRKPAPNTVFNT